MDKRQGDAVSFTKGMLAAGKGPEEIERGLLEKGYTQVEIKQAFRAVINESKAAARLPGPARFPVFSRRPNDNFERLSPLAPLSYLAQRAPLDFLLIILIAAAGAFLLVVAHIGHIDTFQGGTLLALGLGIFIVLAAVDIVYCLYYANSLVFTLEKSCMMVRKGVIAYGYTLIPYENIQDIHQVQSLSDRLFGVWSVVIFTATTTSQGSERIFGLSQQSSERLKESLFAKIKEAKHVTD